MYGDHELRLRGQCPIRTIFIHGRGTGNSPLNAASFTVTNNYSLENVCIPRQVTERLCSSYVKLQSNSCNAETDMI